MDKSKIIKCRNCGMPLKKGTKICSYCQHKAGLLPSKAPKEKRQTGVHIGRLRVRIPWVSLVLILLNVVVGIYKIANNEAEILYHYGMIREALQKGEYLRFVTSGFLHANLAHLASNMYALVIYGFIFENRIGKIRYLLIYLVSLLGASLLINFIGGSGVHIGASGAIWGLMAANLVYCVLTKRKILYLLYALLAVAGNVVYTFAYGVSWQGHLGGAITGLLLAFLLFVKERKAVL